jgi:hypothetical protein
MQFDIVVSRRMSLINNLLEVPPHKSDERVLSLYYCFPKTLPCQVHPVSLATHRHRI